MVTQPNKVIGYLEESFFEQYPDRKNRKGKTARSFMRDEYYKPEYDEVGNVTSWTINPEDDDEYNKFHKMYNLYTPPKSLSPYRAIGQYIVFPSIKGAFLQLANGNEKLVKYIRKIVVATYKIKAYETSVLAGIYNQLVKDPVLNSISNSLEQLKSEFLTSRKLTRGADYNVDFSNQNSDGYKEFERWLFAKKEIKEIVKAYVHDMLANNTEGLKQRLTSSIVQKINNDIENIKEKATNLMKAELAAGQIQ